MSHRSSRRHLFGLACFLVLPLFAAPAGAQNLGGQKLDQSASTIQVATTKLLAKKAIAAAKYDRYRSARYGSNYGRGGYRSYVSPTYRSPQSLGFAVPSTFGRGGYGGYRSYGGYGYGGYGGYGGYRGYGGGYRYGGY